MAGLTAASKFEQRGVTVDVFEKSRGRGGRLASKRLEWATADIGAQYFTAKDERFVRRVESWLRQGLVAQWQFTPYKIQDGGIVTSPDSQRRFVGLPGMSGIARALWPNDNIQFGERITSLRRDAGNWWLQDQAGEEWGPYDRVISTLPPAQAKSLIPAEVGFARQFQEVQLAPCWALVLATRGAVDQNVCGLFGDDTVSWVSRNSSKPGRQTPQGADDTWVLHFASGWTQQNQTNHTGAIVEIGTNWLQQALGTSLKVENSHLHFWRYARLAGEGTIISPLVDKQLGLACIGDWTRQGRVEGAYLSAIELVEEYFA